MKCYCLKFNSPFHVDTRGTGFYEQSDHYIQSSTLSAAIVSSWAMLEPGDAKSWARKPDFLLSSAFPYYKKDNDTPYFFLPRPANSMANELLDIEIYCQFKHIKKLNKIKWLEYRLWHDVVLNEKIEYDQVHIMSNIFACNQRDSENMPGRFWAEEEKPRLYTDRYTNQAIEGKIFHFGRIYFEKGCGLYFLARFNDDNAQSKFEAALTLLGDSGIGSDRSSGNGFFTWETNETFVSELLNRKHQQTHVCLSLLNPCMQEQCENECKEKDCQMDWVKDSRYQLLTNSGWIGTSGKQRKSLRMFSEGSCFPKKLNGRIVKIGKSREGYYVFRDGRGFFI